MYTATTCPKQTNKKIIMLFGNAMHGMHPHLKTPSISQ